MKKIFKNSSIIVCIIVLLFSTNYTTVKAAETASVSIGSGTATVGDTVSITVNISSASDMVMVSLWLAYDATVLEYVSGASGGSGGFLQLLKGDGGTDVYRNVSYTIVFKAIAPGTSNLSIDKSHAQCFVAGGMSEMTINASSGSITTKAPANVTYSSNNSLSSLQISPGTLSPAFSPDNTDYTATVGSDCANLIVSAIAADGTASTKITGTKMDTGANTTTILVTAQDGSTKKYIIRTNKEAAGTPAPAATTAVPAATTEATPTQAATAVAPVTVTVNGILYHVVSDFSNHPLPTGYSAVEFDLNGQKVTAGKGINKLTILYLEKEDGSGEGGFFVYDTIAKTFSLLSTVSQPALAYTILPITKGMELPSGFTMSSLEIAGNIVDVLIPDSANTTFCLIYGVDANGNAGWYRYDYTERTIQKYYSGNNTSNAVTNTTNDSDTDELLIWKILAVAAALVIFALLIATILLASKLKSKKSVFGNANDDDDDDDDESTLYVEKEDPSNHAINGSTNDSSNDSVNNTVNYIAAMESANALENALENANAMDTDKTSDIAFDFEEEDVLLEEKAIDYDIDNDDDISELTDILEDEDGEAVNMQEAEEDIVANSGLDNSSELSFDGAYSNANVDDFEDDFEFLDLDDTTQDLPEEDEFKTTEDEFEITEPVVSEIIDTEELELFDTEELEVIDTEELDIEDLNEDDLDEEELEILDLEEVSDDEDK